MALAQHAAAVAREALREAHGNATGARGVESKEELVELTKEVLRLQSRESQVQKEKEHALKQLVTHLHREKLFSLNLFLLSFASSVVSP